MKRLFVFAAFVFASLSVWAFPKPSAEITRFEVDAITLRDVTFQFELTVKNPYPVALKFDGVDMDFSVEGAKVFHAASQGGFSVKAKGEKANVFTVTLPYEGIIKLVKNYIDKDWLETQIDGTLVIPLPKMPGVPKTISFDYKLKKKIPAIKPEVSLVGFSVAAPTAEQVGAAVAKAGSKVSPSKAFGVFKDVLAGKKPAESVIDPTDIDVPLTLSYTLEIKNDAKGPLGFDKLDYELLINSEALVQGTSSKVERKGNSTLVTVVNEFSSKRLSKNVKALFVDKKGSFQVKGKASLKLPDEIRKEPIPLGFDETGTFGF